MQKHFEPLYLIVAALVFLLFLIFCISVHDDNRKIKKAARVLHIPKEYIDELKHYLLTLYKYHPTIHKLKDKEFLEYITLYEAGLLFFINRKYKHLISIHRMIKEDNEEFSNQFDEPLPKSSTNPAFEYPPSSF